MPKELTWSDSEDIGILLSEIHPELDPLAVRFTDLHKYVTRAPRLQRRPCEVERGQAGSHPDGMAFRGSRPNPGLILNRRPVITAVARVARALLSTDRKGEPFKLRVRRFPCLHFPI